MVHCCCWPERAFHWPASSLENHTIHLMNWSLTQTDIVPGIPWEDKVHHNVQQRQRRYHLYTKQTALLKKCFSCSLVSSKVGNDLFVETHKMGNRWPRRWTTADDDNDDDDDGYLLKPSSFKATFALTTFAMTKWKIGCT